tara:strand:+ start:277 stop:492 length:216 start_codon:yes stop_codon:yes gene_type:complete
MKRGRTNGPGNGTGGSEGVTSTAQQGLVVGQGKESKREQVKRLVAGGLTPREARKRIRQRKKNKLNLPSNL